MLLLAFFFIRSIEEMIPMGLISLYYHMPDVAVIRPLILLIYFLFFLYFSCWTDCVFFPTVCLVDHSNRNEGSDECTFVFLKICKTAVWNELASFLLYNRTRFIHLTHLTICYWPMTKSTPARPMTHNSDIYILTIITLYIQHTEVLF